MPVLPHTRVTFNGIFGTLVNPFEKWSFGLNLNFSDLASPSSKTGLVAAGTTGVVDLMQSVSSMARLTEIKAVTIGADGKYTSDPVIAAVDIAGSGTPSQTVPQVAAAVTLDTATRGARGRGRIYVPVPAVVPGADGRISDAFCNNLSIRVRTLIQALNAGANVSPGKVSVISSFGVSSPVNSVRTGNVVDTIRSRRRQMQENYPADFALQDALGVQGSGAEAAVPVAASH